MASRWNDVLITCPYFISMDAKKGSGPYISCDGSGQAKYMQMIFESRAACLEHMRKYCAGNRWECASCLSIDCSYEKEEGV